jgi:hypothetical protein
MTIGSTWPVLERIAGCVWGFEIGERERVFGGHWDRARFNFLLLQEIVVGNSRMTRCLSYDGHGDRD